ncbi:MAG TPA: tryptophan--tRNA ligase [Actinomycetota bacterium]|jgi:tryptophanyl-tRNA synthetase|nr:tryptophan--tRNA ligase [Actinomycetota bacterium]
MPGRKVALTGIQPSGTPHIGNYLGMIRPALELARDYDAYYFIADGHALTTVRDPQLLRDQTYEIAAVMLALGLDPERVVLYRQSDIREVFELAWILSSVTPKGLLNRAHAYKDAVAENEAAGRPADDGVSMGLFSYPVLMAADILIVDANVVPVGSDQRQHVEMARDMAEAFNRAYGEVFVLPEPLIDDSVATITGLDGRKMSKSYGNVIPIFGSPAEQRKLVKRIVTDSRPPEEPKDPETDNLFQIYASVAPPERVEAMRERYIAGGLGYGEVKEELAGILEDVFAAPRDRYDALMSDRTRIEEVLADGARRARQVTNAVTSRARKAVGLES